MGASRASGFQEALIWEINMTVNRTAIIDYVDVRIAQTSHPKHIEQLKVLRAHMAGEVGEDVDALLATISRCASSIARRVPRRTCSRPRARRSGRSTCAQAS
jgi:hypothetical protein